MANRAVTEEWKTAQVSVSLPGYMRAAMREQDEPQSETIKKALTLYLNLKEPEYRYVDQLPEVKNKK